ncbi:hypothetical protein RDWZM_006808 [Blomia tropicalis]|uniref:Decapping nuclease n=1 Tax=Blomia tropicalis TaxID=40697 RepID=A0A9Q0M7S5_BLOTA|nr:hypothetical protein BLOT_013265 [Blomia tropicalis]KAJ6220996.1 hypothetical protein RDWZM_006808 [Blomia tropicalis]
MASSYSLKDLDPSSYERKKSIDCTKSSIEVYEATLNVPTKIGHFSVKFEKDSEHREVIFDECLSYLKLPPKGEEINFDLSDGYYKYSHINWVAAPNVKLDEILRWIVDNRNSLFLFNDKKPLETDFLSYRGVFTKIMTAPFVQEKWLIGATKFKGTIYLCPYYENDTPNEIHNEFSYGGIRFEDYITLSNPSKLSHEKEPFTLKRNEYFMVLRNKIQSYESSFGKIDLMYAAEFDCLDEGMTNSSFLENFVEIKTTRHMRNEYHIQDFHRKKLIKWWCQCYLGGVDKIICGYKNRNVVDEIESMDVNQIPRMCVSYWSRGQCFSFLRQFLAFVQQTVVDDDPNQVYLFSNEDVFQISSRKLLVNSHFQILPEWYIREWSKNSKNVDSL